MWARCCLSIDRVQGFGFSLDTLNPKDDSDTREFTDALRVLTNGQAPGLITVLRGIVPLLRAIVRSIIEARKSTKLIVSFSPRREHVALHRLERC